MFSTIQFIQHFCMNYMLPKGLWNWCIQGGPLSPVINQVITGWYNPSYSFMRPFIRRISPFTTRKGRPCTYQSSKCQWFCLSHTCQAVVQGDDFLRWKRLGDVWLEVRINGWDYWAVDVYPRNKAWFRLWLQIFYFPYFGKMNPLWQKRMSFFKMGFLKNHQAVICSWLIKSMFPLRPAT